MSLYQLEREADAGTLVEYLRHGSKPEVRRRAASILGDLEDPSHGPVAGDDDPLAPDAGDRDERGEAGLDDEDGVVDALVTAATDDDAPTVRGAAVDALDRHGASAIERLVEELTDREVGSDADWVTAQAFAELLDADRPELRMAAAVGLGQVGDERVTPALVDRLDDPDQRVRVRAARACGRVGDPRAVEPLAERADDKSAAVRRAVASALGALGTTAALRALEPLVADDSEAIRRTAVDALGDFQSVEPVDPLVDALHDPSEAVRRTAVFALVEVLSNAPPVRSHEARERAVDRLEEVDHGSVVGPLAAILEEAAGSPQRRNAAWLLGRVAGGTTGGEAQSALIEALDDRDDRTAQFAASSLTSLEGTGLERRLLALLDDPTASIDARAQALYVLGKVGDERARERLGRFVDETDEERLRKRAFSALSKLGGAPGGETL
jgi:HEAT repeat protein